MHQPRSAHKVSVKLKAKNEAQALMHMSLRYIHVVGPSCSKAILYTVNSA